MIKNKFVSIQIHEFQYLVTQLEADGMPQIEKFMARVLLEKLPPSWKDYQNHVRRKREFATKRIHNSHSFGRKQPSERKDSKI